MGRALVTSDGGFSTEEFSRVGRALLVCLLLSIFAPAPGLIELRIHDDLEKMEDSSADTNFSFLTVC